MLDIQGVESLDANAVMASNNIKMDEIEEYEKNQPAQKVTF